MFATALIAKLLKFLKKSLYVYPGGTIASIFHECKKGGVDLIVSKAEQGAGYMAIAESLLTREPAFVAVTSGPGATNLITCIADAYYDSIPLIVFTGQVGTADLSRSEKIRQRGFQEVPIADIVKKITKKAYQPKNVEQLVEVLIEGCRLSQSGRPGPVLIDLPMNLQMANIGPDVLNGFCPEKVVEKDTEEELGKVATQDIQAFRKLLSKSKTPLILLGGGAQQDFVIVRNFAAKYNIPIISSIRGIGVMPTEHPLFVGWAGHTGLPWANWAFYEADFLLVLGSRLDIRQTGSELGVFETKRIVQVDIDINELEHCRINQDIAIHSPVGAFLDQIASSRSLDVQSCDAWLKEIRTKKESMPLGDHGQDKGVRPDELLRYVNDLTKDKKSAIVTGVGSHQQWVSRYFSFDNPKKVLFTSAGHGTMGYSLPVALGLQRIERDRLVISIDGDGSFQMNIQELALIREHDLNVKIIVMDNSRLGIVSQFQKMTFADDPTTGDFRSPDFSLIANGYGIKARRIDSLDKPSIDQFLNSQEPSLLHVRVQKDAPVSPMLLSGQPLDKMWYHD